MLDADLWTSYSQTHLKLDIDGPMTVEPVAVGGAPTLGRGFEANPDWPFPDAAEVWVVTAFNPLSEQLSAEANAERHAELLRILTAEGFDPMECVGTDPQGTWAETSWLVVGIQPNRAIALGRQFQQRAVFRWTPSTLEVVGAVDEGHVVMTWRKVLDS